MKGSESTTRSSDKMWVSMAAATRPMNASQPASFSASVPSRFSNGFLIAFDIIYLLGLVSLGAIILTVWLSPTIKRASTWMMVIFSWIITSLGNLLLVGQQTGRLPLQGVCLAQAMFIYGTPVFASFYATAFMIQVYLSIRFALRSNSTITRTHMIFFHGVPCVSFFLIMLEVLIYGLVFPDTVERSPLGMYCHIRTSLPEKITAALTIAALAVFLSVEIAIAVILWRFYTSTGKLIPLRTQEHISLDVAIRVVVFGFCPSIAIGVSSLYYLPHTKVRISVITLIQASLPIVAGVIFGTQRDILYVWMFWKKKKSDDPELGSLAV